MEQGTPAPRFRRDGALLHGDKYLQTDTNSNAAFAHVLLVDMGADAHFLRPGKTRWNDDDEPAPLHPGRSIPSLEVEIFPVVERSSSCGHANSHAFAFAPNFPVNTISADAY
jgi:hypothetical protein